MENVKSGKLWLHQTPDLDVSLQIMWLVYKYEKKTPEKNKQFKWSSTFSIEFST